jgi:hypothetical protein
VRRKQFFASCVLGLLLLVSSRTAWCQSAADLIKQVLNDQTAAWNRADINGFMTGYENSPETTFVGKNVLHGWQQMMERYQKTYPTKEAMGTLDFSEINVRRPCRGDGQISSCANGSGRRRCRRRLFTRI